MFKKIIKEITERDFFDDNNKDDEIIKNLIQVKFDKDYPNINAKIFYKNEIRSKEYENSLKNNDNIFVLDGYSIHDGTIESMISNLSYFKTKGALPREFCAKITDSKISFDFEDPNFYNDNTLNPYKDLTIAELFDGNTKKYNYPNFSKFDYTKEEIKQLIKEKLDRDYPGHDVKIYCDTDSKDNDEFFNHAMNNRPYIDIFTWKGKNSELIRANIFIEKDKEGIGAYNITPFHFNISEKDIVIPYFDKESLKYIYDFDSHQSSQFEASLFDNIEKRESLSKQKNVYSFLDYKFAVTDNCSLDDIVIKHNLVHHNQNGTFSNSIINHYNELLNRFNSLQTEDINNFKKIFNYSSNTESGHFINPQYFNEKQVNLEDLNIVKNLSKADIKTLLQAKINRDYPEYKLEIFSQSEINNNEQTKEEVNNRVLNEKPTIIICDDKISKDFKDSINAKLSIPLKITGQIKKDESKDITCFKGNSRDIFNERDKYVDDYEISEKCIAFNHFNFGDEKPITYIDNVYNFALDFANKENDDISNFTLDITNTDITISDALKENVFTNNKDTSNAKNLLNFNFNNLCVDNIVAEYFFKNYNQNNRYNALLELKAKQNYKDFESALVEQLVNITKKHPNLFDMSKLNKRTDNDNKGDGAGNGPQF